MEIKNLLGNKQKRTYRREVFRYYRAGFVLCLIIMALIYCAVFGNTKNTSPNALETKIEVKAVENTIEKPKDWENDLVGYFRHAGERIGYDEFDITKLHAVMDCENGLHTADRKNYLYDGENGRYTAGGFAMITNSTWRQHKCTGNKFDGTDNIDCFYKIIGDNQGLGDYRESKSCWVQRCNPNDIVFIKVK
jgi:hypothetical protein